MMFQFDASKVQFKRVKVKSINTLAGSINIVDESYLTKEKITKLECSNIITRTFKSVHDITFFQVPHECCIMLYDGIVIALEKAVLNERTYIGLDDKEHLWTPDLEKNFKKLLEMLGNHEWYFDGSYVYSFKKSLDLAIQGGDYRNDDGSIRAIKCYAILINLMGYNDDLYELERNCLGYIADNGDYSISPPLWKGNTFITTATIDAGNGETLVGRYDYLDANYVVNLQFAIVAGINITKVFGYKTIEPLQLPKLMVQLLTVNLQSIPTEIKQTFDIGMSVSQATAWLMGLLLRVKSFEDYMAMSKLLKYLVQTGTTKRTKLSDMYINGTEAEIPLLTMEQAYENALAVSDEEKH